MNNRITILVQHSGEWDMQHKFKNFSVDGVLISMDWDFKSIRSEISKILGVDANTDMMDIQYSVKEYFPPMKLYDERSLGLYLELKSKKLSFTDYPLCITFKGQGNDATCSIPVVNKANSSHFQNLPMVDINMEPVEWNNSGNREDNDVMHIVEECIIGISTHQEVNEGQLYKNKDVLQNAMKHLAIREKFQFKVDRSNKTRYYLVCVDDQCSWNLKASSLNTSNIFKVRKFKKVHTRGNNSRLSSQRQATSNLVGSLIMNKLDDPKLEYTPAEIKRGLKRDYEVDLNYMKAWRSREKSFELLRGKPSDSYNKLPRFLYMLMHTNPGSVTRWSVAHSIVNRSMVMTSNIVESMNSANKAARDLPIYDMLDYLMKLVGAWNNTNRNATLATDTTLSTKYEIMLREKIIASRSMTGS
uniref:Uncharacterized protein LOC104214468 n=1 Tax=Nicotiana sylvestris TaxID=4096 RepID=A0A1U7VBU3_NICSY|nr:PREDICTED: uncharacterized protein LOC104214468 [Nicotiana sylvestris]